MAEEQRRPGETETAYALRRAEEKNREAAKERSRSDSYSSKFEEEMLKFIRQQNFGSQKIGLGPLSLKSDQSENASLARISLQITRAQQDGTIKSLGKVGEQIADKIGKVSKEAVMASAEDQKILLEQLRAFKSMIPMLEDSTQEQRESKAKLEALFKATESSLKKNSRLGNRVTEGLKANLPSISGIISGLFSKSPVVGAMVNFALEKYAERREKREEAARSAAEEMMEAAKDIYEAQFMAQQNAAEVAKELADAQKEQVEAIHEEIVAKKQKIKEELAESTAPIKVPNALQSSELHGNPEFTAGIAEGMLEELETLNSDEMEALKVSLADLLKINIEELRTLEDVRDALMKASESQLNAIEQFEEASTSPISEESALEGERQMDEQTLLLREIRDAVVGMSSGKGKGSQDDNFDLTDSWAAFELVKKGWFALKSGFLKIGGLLAGFAGTVWAFTKTFGIRIAGLAKGLLGRLVSLPGYLAIGLAKGLYDGVKQFIDGGSIGESIKTALVSAGDFLTLGLTKYASEFLSNHGILDPVFKIYDYLRDSMTTLFEKLVEGSQKVWSIVTDPIGSAVAVYDKLKAGMTALFEEAAGFVQDPLGYARDLFAKGKESIREFFVELIPTWVPDRFLPDAIRADVQKYRGRNEPDLSSDPRVIWMDTPESFAAVNAATQISPGYGKTGPTTRRRKHTDSTSPAPVSQYSNQSSSTSPISISDSQTALIEGLKSQGISDPSEIANVMAQVQAESGFKPQSENLNYSPERLFELFGVGNKYGNKGYVRSLEHAKELAAKGPEAIGNTIYGSRMGNNGEGFKFRGRGLIQLTGRDNYKKYGEMIGVDLVNNPDLANDPEIAAKIAGAYFGNMKKSGVNLGNISSVGKAVGYATGEAETANRARLAEDFKAQLDFGTVPRQEAKVDGLNKASSQVSQAEIVNRARVESRTSSANINQNTVVQQSSNAPSGISRPTMIDPTLRHADPVLV